MYKRILLVCSLLVNGLSADEANKETAQSPSVNVAVLQAEAKALRTKVERLQSQVEFLNKMLVQIQTERDAGSEYNRAAMDAAKAKCGNKPWTVDYGVVTCTEPPKQSGDNSAKGTPAKE